MPPVRRYPDAPSRHRQRDARRAVAAAARVTVSTD
jgi:hypothetical protein